MTFDAFLMSEKCLCLYIDISFKIWVGLTDHTVTHSRLIFLD
jgi:hypothetical protein